MYPEQTEELTMPAKKRFGLTEEERLFPGPRHPGQERQKQPIRLFAYRSLDLSTQDHELLPQQRVFRQQFGFASGQIGDVPSTQEVASGLFRRKRVLGAHASANKLVV